MTGIKSAYLTTGLVTAGLGLACQSPPAVQPLDADSLQDPAACRACHPDHFRAFSGSMHAYAAEDPVFRAMNAKGQRETGGALGDFCVACHAPVAVALGLTTDGLNLDEVPAHLRGVTCAFCHLADAIEGAHNNPVRMADDGVMRGGLRDPLPNTAHASKYSSLHDGSKLDSAALCGSCHDVVTPAGVHLDQTFAEWKQTVYATDDRQRGNSCVACHMPGRDGVTAEVPGVSLRRVHDHAMPGVDVALTDFPERAAQLDAVQTLLDYSLIAELCVIEQSGGADIELYLENVAAGHAFPSGAAQDRQVWVEVVAKAGGRTLLEVGVVNDDEPLGKDPALWLLGDVMYDENDEPTHDFWDARRVERSFLPAPTPFRPGQPDYVNTHVPRRYRIVGPPLDLVTVRVRMRAMGLEVLRELVVSGDLDPEVVSRMPTYTLAGSVLEWSPATADLRTSPLTGLMVPCVGVQAPPVAQ
ncbi:MAG: hypothetical protein EXR76_07740 [Myxococcales bacterium]|nr:hypothetical protein [Myxococcales bacterium]